MIIIYLYFNYYYFLDSAFRDKLKSCQLKYAINSADVSLEDEYFPYCRMRIQDKNDILNIINEFNQEIYKYTIYP